MSPNCSLLRVNIFGVLNWLIEAFVQAGLVIDIINLLSHWAISALCLLNVWGVW